LWDQHADPWVTVLHAGAAYTSFGSIFSLLALLGLLLARRADALQTFPREAIRGASSAPLSAAMLLFPVTYYITHSAMRYRHPIDPVMTVLAVYAAACVYRRVAAKTEERSPGMAVESRRQRRARSRRTVTTD
jgi:hypothetical protein